MRRFLRVIAFALLVLVLAAAALLALSAAQGELPRVLGFSHLVVVSGSMQPAIEAGDLIVIRKQDNYGPGDVVTYRDGASLITHRVVALQDGWLITQGDANNAPDAPVDPVDVAGKMVLRLPRVGSWLLRLRTPPGVALLLLAVAALTLLSHRKERSA